MTMINFQKLEGIGNDFILLDSRVNSFMPTAKQAVKWCDRRFGIGADGILVLLKPKSGADFKMRILNSDGSEPEMCGNGIRCLAQYVYSHNLTEKPSVKVATLAGTVNVRETGRTFPRGARQIRNSIPKKCRSSPRSRSSAKL